MARVRTVPAEELTGADREVYERAASYGEFGSLLGAMANRPPVMRNTWNLLLELRAEGVLPKRYLELALVMVSKLNECTYCVSHHTPFLTISGVSDEAATNILDFENQAEFDDVDKLVCEYAREVTVNWNRVRDDLYARLREHFDDAQLVELTWRIALCGAFNRFNDVLQTDVEDGVDVLPQHPADAA
ncbi:MAG: carboxymuconolactone decarboxylase family protein [Pseudomonadota bacterium]